MLLLLVCEVPRACRADFMVMCVCCVVCASANRLAFAGLGFIGVVPTGAQNQMCRDWLKLSVRFRSRSTTASAFLLSKKVAEHEARRLLNIKSYLHDESI